MAISEIQRYILKN